MLFCRLTGFCIVASVICSVLCELGSCRRRNIWDADPCFRGEDCAGSNTVCVNNNCTCGENFERQLADGGGWVCKAAPSDVDADCVSHCKPPLTCQNGKCKCIRASVQGSKCVITCPSGHQPDARGNCVPPGVLGAQCSQESDCTAPFTTCYGGSCQCLSGLSQSGDGCRPKCPDGNEAVRTCKRLFDGNSKLLDAFDKDDTCEVGEYCTTFGKPAIGLCCPLRCPYGNALTDRSCEDTAAGQSNACPRDTHLCYTVKGFDFSNTLCCPRPCHEPTPFYINGQCFSRSFLGDACVSDEQCEGGLTMSCRNGKCACRDGDYVAATDTKFPTCVKKCPGGELPLASFCQKPSQLAGTCLTTKECPLNSDCRDGRCQCKCGTKALLGGCAGGAAFNPSSIIDIFKGIGK